MNVCVYIPISTGVWCNTRSGNKRPSFPTRPPCCRPCDVISTPTQPQHSQLTFLFPSSSSSSSSFSSAATAAHTFTRAAAWRHRVTRIEVMTTRAPRVVPPSPSSAYWTVNNYWTDRVYHIHLWTAFVVCGTRGSAKTAHKHHNRLTRRALIGF